MNLRDPRFQKTLQVACLVIFGVWIGEIDARPTLEVRHWVLLVVCLVGIASAGYIVLYDVYKRKP